MADLVITVLIIGTFAAVAAPKLANSLQRKRADHAVRRIEVDLGYARQTEVNKSGALSVNFAFASNSYSVLGWADLNRSGPTYATALSDAPNNDPRSRRLSWVPTATSRSIATAGPIAAERSRPSPVPIRKQ